MYLGNSPTYQWQCSHTFAEIGIRWSQCGQARVAGEGASGGGGNAETSPKICITPVSVTAERGGGEKMKTLAHLGHFTLRPAIFVSPRSRCPEGQLTVIWLMAEPSRKDGSGITASLGPLSEFRSLSVLSVRSLGSQS